jgi:hypothetical protein
MIFKELLIKMDFHDYARDKTDKLHDALLDSKLSSRFNSDWDINNYLGALGECLFSEWLSSERIIFRWNNDVFGESDDGDFIINGRKWDVKTAWRKESIDSLKDNYSLMLCHDQVGLHADNYFWIFVQGKDAYTSERAFLVGSLNQFQVRDFPVFKLIVGKNDSMSIVPTIKIPVNALVSLRDTLNIMRD